MPTGDFTRPNRRRVSGTSVERDLAGIGKNLLHAGDCARDVVITGEPITDGDTHHPHAPPGRTAEPRDTPGLDTPDDFVGKLVVVAAARQETHQALIDDRFRHDLGAWKLSDAPDQPLGMCAAALDDLGDPRAAERPHRRIDGKTAATPRPFGVPVLLVAQLLSRYRIARLLRKGGPMSGGVRNENETGVEWHVQPFVRVRRPGISAVRTRQQMAVTLAGGDPEADRTVDMNPSLGCVRDLACVLEGIKNPGVQI